MRTALLFTHLRRTIITGVAACCLPLSATSQISLYTFSQSNGVYTPITGGTVLATATQPVTHLSDAGSIDDYVYGSYTLPFTFHFAGGRTSFRPVSNGYIVFGPGTYNAYYPISDTGYSAVMAPMAVDLEGNFRTTGTTTSGSNLITDVFSTAPLRVGAPIIGSGIPSNTTITAISGNSVTISNNATSSNTNTMITSCTGEIRVEVVGTAPNRTAIIQYSGMTWSGSSPSANLNSLVNFQIHLSEGGGLPENQTVSFVYGPTQYVPTGASNIQVGIRGSDTSDYNNRSSTIGWGNTTMGSSRLSTVTWSSLNTPSSGLTYTWTPPPACVAPAAQPTGLVLNASATIITGSFTGVPDADGYLIVRRQWVSTLDAQPVNGTVYHPGNSLGNGTVVSSDTLTSFINNNRPPNATFYYFVYAYNDSCAGGPVYDLINPLTTSVTTKPFTAFTWNPTSGSADASIASNWTPARIIPDPTDTLYFGNGGTPTVTNLHADVLAKLGVRNGTDATLVSGGSRTILLRKEFLIDSSSSLNITGDSNLTISFTPVPNPVQTGTIAGNLIMGGLGTLIYHGTNGITTITGTVTMGENSAFTNDVTSNFVFDSGSHLYYARNGGFVPGATYDVNSTVHITGVTTNAPALYTYIGGKLVWDSPLQTAVGLPFNLNWISGGFEMVNSGTGSMHFGHFTPIVTIMAPTTITGGNFQVMGSTMNFNGGLTISGGTFTAFSPDPNLDPIGNNLTTLNVNGDLIQTGGSIIGASSSGGTLVLNVTGDIDQSGGAITQNTGASTRIAFTGSTMQEVNLDGTNTGIINYEVANPAGVSMSSDLVLNNNSTLTINQGKLYVGANTLRQSATASITGASQTSGWVVGRLQRNVAAGNINHTFQVGDSNYYTPVTVSGTPGAVSVGGDITAHTTSGDHPAITYAQLNPSLSVNRHYTMQTGNGIVFTPGSLAMTLNWNAADVDAGANAAAFVTARNMGGNTWVNLDETAQTATSIQVTGLSDLDGEYQVAEFLQVPLDIKLVSFGGERSGAGNRLTWVTSSEDPGDHFELQRSEDGKAYQSLSTIAVKGQPSRYTFTDADPVAGNNFYRLKMVSLSGKIAYSQVVVLKGDADEASISVYPNPMQETVTVSLSKSPQNGTVMILDMTGKLIRQVTTTGLENTINVADLAPGTYLIRFMDDNIQRTMRVTRQ